MSRNLTLAAAVIATFSLGFATTEASAQDLGGFLRISDRGIAIGIGDRGHDHNHDHGRAVHYHPRYETVNERVYRQGYWKTVEVPAQYRTIGHGCYQRQILVRPARCERVWVAGYWEIVPRRVQVGQTACYDDHRPVIRRDDCRDDRRDDRRDNRRDNRRDDRRGNRR